MQNSISANSLYRWELFTGQVPYGSLGLSSIQIGMRVLTKGLRPSPLPNQETSPPLIIELIQKCWDLDPNKRLEFDVILECLNAVIIGIFLSSLPSPLSPLLFPLPHLYSSYLSPCLFYFCLVLDISLILHRSIPSGLAREHTSIRQSEARKRYTLSPLSPSPPLPSSLFLLMHLSSRRMQDLFPFEDQHVPGTLWPPLRVQRVRRACNPRHEGFGGLPDLSKSHPESRHHLPIVTDLEPARFVRIPSRGRFVWLIKVFLT